MVRLLLLVTAVAVCAAPSTSRGEVDEIIGTSFFEAEEFARANAFRTDETRSLVQVEAYVDCVGETVTLSVWHLTEPLGSTFSLVASESTVGSSADGGWLGAQLPFELEANETYAVGFWSASPCTYSWASGDVAQELSWGEHLGGLARNEVLTSPANMYGPAQLTAYAMRLETDASQSDDDDATDDDDAANDDDAADDDDAANDDDDGVAGCSLGQSPGRLGSVLLLLAAVGLRRRR